MTYARGAGNLFIMPERMARAPAAEKIKEYVGSGPFVFKRDEWVSGAVAAYERNRDYIRRQERPDASSGGQEAYFERIEWVVQPDPATAGT